MKKSISILLCIVLIFSSFSFSFATATSWDTSDQANLQYIKNTLTSGGTLYSVVNTIATRLVFNNVSIAQIAQNIYNSLTVSYNGSNRTVAWLLADIDAYLGDIYSTLTGTASGSIGYYLSNILGMLSYSENGTLKSWLLSIDDYNYKMNNNLTDLRYVLYNTYMYKSSFTDEERRKLAHINWINSYGNYSLPNLDSNFNYSYTSHAFQNGDILGNIGFILYRLANNQGISSYRSLTGYNLTQSPLDWTTLNTLSFTAESQTTGLYKWLSNIQAPVARLSYVLASDQRIEAQELAADNEQAVVDNFIDSTGSGAASTSDFDSIADFSSGYKSTFASDASPTGIFDIFNSNNMGWFSQETANQLDTTSNNRAKSDNTFNTPLLDEQINSIYEQLGVKQP